MDAEPGGHRRGRRRARGRHRRHVAAVAARRPARALPRPARSRGSRCGGGPRRWARSGSRRSGSPPPSARSRGGRSRRSPAWSGSSARSGSSIRGRTSALAWTRRLQTLAGVSAGALCVAMGVAAAFTPAPFAIAAGVVVVAAPRGRRVGRRSSPRSRTASRAPWVRAGTAAARGRSRPPSSRSPAATARPRPSTTSPSCWPGRRRSCRRRGASTTARVSRWPINEHLVDGTKVFIAEMGTYRRGEIRVDVRVVPPRRRGPHRDRPGAPRAVRHARAHRGGEGRDHRARSRGRAQRRRRAAGRARDPAAREGPRRASPPRSARPDADVRVEVGRRALARRRATAWRSLVTSPIPGVQPTNLACALAAGVALGARPARRSSARIARVAPVANRLTVASAPSGVLVVDDTFNANPAGASAALELLAQPARRRDAGSS